MGISNLPEYKIYKEAERRCKNPNCHKYYAYGARGIKFLFSSFEEFYNHIGNRPSKEYSLDRIDNNGNYEIGNVRWATLDEQNRNKRNYGIVNRQGKGYQFHKATQKWQARIEYKGIRKYLGVFDTEEEAKLAYDNAFNKIKEQILYEQGIS